MALTMRFKFLLILPVILAGCALTYTTSYTIGPDLSVEELQGTVGSTRSELIEKMGPPSFLCLQEQNNVCYYSQKRHHDVIKEQRYVEFVLDENDKVSEIVVSTRH